MHPNFKLISHLLCPYVQRVVIVLQEKHLPYERIDIDLANKPDWFLKVSALGKTPVLLVGQQPIFESAVICDYLDETTPQPLHPLDPLIRAQHRAWIEFASSTLNAIGAMYSANNDQTFGAACDNLRTKFIQLEAELSRTAADGPYFSGASFCMVDAAFAPVFRYFDVFDTIEAIDVLSNAPKVRAWRAALQQRPSVQKAAHADYPRLLTEFLIRRKSELSRRLMLDA